MKKLNEYGVEPMTFDDEINLWKTNRAKAQTRSDKVRMLKSLQSILYEGEILIKQVKRIPEDDDEAHSELVKALADELESIKIRFTSCYARHASYHG